jgi:predicted phosphodiesterase
MRIALISDVHGMAVALRAVLEDIDGQGCDEVVFLGDAATLGPDPAEVVELLVECRAVCVRGNHDEFVLEPATVRSYTEVAAIIDAVNWCRAQLSESHLRFLRTFVAVARRPFGTKGLVAFHGSPRSCTQDLLATTDAAELDRHLAGVAADVWAAGHTHLQMLRQHRGSLLVNPGSVGMPFREYTGGKMPTILDHAEYAIAATGEAGVEVSLRRIPVDREETVARLRASSCPMAEQLLLHYAAQNGLGTETALPPPWVARS